MYDFLTENPVVAVVFIVIVVAIALFLLVKAMQTIGMEKIRVYVYHLFVEAEHEFKYGENEDKFNYVICLAKGFIPSPFNLFITEKLLRKVVQTWFTLCKDLLDDGKLNKSEKESE